VPTGFAFVNVDQAQKYKAQHVRAGDLVFTCWGTLGQVALIPEDGPYNEYIISNKQLKFRPDTSVADSLYLFYYFACPEMVQHVLSKAIGAAVPGINLGILKELPVVLPPLEDQRRIAGILSAYDDLIENCQRRIRILEEMARSLYREWFVHFRYPGHESVPMVDSPLGPVSQGWNVLPFTEMVHVLSGGTPKTDNPDYWDGDIPWFTPRDAPSTFFATETLKHVTELGLGKCASALYEPDTVFITARGTVGKVAMAGVPMAMNQSCYALRGKGDVSQRYLFMMILHQVEYLKTNTGGATFDTIVVDTFKRMKVLHPGSALIAQFTAVSEATFSQIKCLENEARNLRRTRDLLLPKLLRSPDATG